MAPPTLEERVARLEKDSTELRTNDETQRRQLARHEDAIRVHDERQGAFEGTLAGIAVAWRHKETELSLISSAMQKQASTITEQAGFMSRAAAKLAEHEKRLGKREVLYAAAIIFGSAFGQVIVQALHL